MIDWIAFGVLIGGFILFLYKFIPRHWGGIKWFDKF